MKVPTDGAWGKRGKVRSSSVYLSLARSFCPEADGKAVGQKRTSVACCRFRGHEDKIVTMELGIGYDETEVQPRVQN